MTLGPHAITWKEFRALRMAWGGDRRSSVLSDWIAQHMSVRYVSLDDVEDELFETIMTRRNSTLATAADSASIQEHDSNVNEARILLEMLAQFLVDLGKLTPMRFREVYGQASYWIGFRKNPSDKTVRDAEENTLLKLLSSAPRAMATELLEVVYPQNFFPEIDNRAAERQELRNKCFAIVAPIATKEAIDFINRQDGVRCLTEQGRFAGVKYCLFHRDSPVWKTELREILLSSIRKGRADFEIYVNVRDYFNLLVEGCENGIDSIGKRDILPLLLDEEFVRDLWQVVTSKEIQYRSQMSFSQGVPVNIPQIRFEDIARFIVEVRGPCWQDHGLGARSAHPQWDPMIQKIWKIGDPSNPGVPEEKIKRILDCVDANQ
jgi:hypothetical protein